MIVLAKDRPRQLENLLHSLENARYDGSRVALHIRIDGSGDTATVQVAKKFTFSHGSKTLVVAKTELGLAKSWYNAWKPRRNERAIILEDDIVLSPDWFKFLSRAWQAYGKYDELAGISLQRQTLVPYHGHHEYEIVSDHEPFLYPLVGSIGFSPSSSVWRRFTSWIDSIDLNNFNVSTPGLVTSDWWNVLDKKNMWTQHFIYFCVKFDLYTLYINLEDSKTLAAHTRAKGTHFQQTLGADFDIAPAGKALLKMPTSIRKFDWDGIEKQAHQSVGDVIQRDTIASVASQIQLKDRFVFLMFLNDGFSDFIQNWFCNMVRVNEQVLTQTIFVTTGDYIARVVAELRPDLHVFSIRSPWKNPSSFGTFAYFKIVTERLRIQQHLLTSGINVFVIEADQIWRKDIRPIIDRYFFNETEIIGGEENGFGMKSSEEESRICGGFFGIRSTSKTIAFFRKYLELYELHLEREKYNLSEFEDDQAFLTRTAISSGISFSMFSSCEYANGLWFKASNFRSLCPDPFVLHNNYVIGAHEKLKRSKGQGYWFVDGGGNCM